MRLLMKLTWHTLGVAMTALVLLAGVTPVLSAEPACTDVPQIASVHVDENDRPPPVAGVAPAAYMNDRILVKVCALNKLLDSGVAAQKPVNLFINGSDTGLAPISTDRQSSTLGFKLERTAQNAELWKPLLADPLSRRHGELRISVGVAASVPLDRAVGAVSELPFNKLWVDAWTWASGVLVVAVVVLTLYFGKNSDMLRDSPTIDDSRQTYSLARVQMAWWFVLVVVGFIVIFLVSGNLDSIPATIVALTGISATTGVAAVFITPRPAQRAMARKAGLDERRSALADGLVDIDASIASASQQLAVAPGDATLTSLVQGLQDRRATRVAEINRVALEMAAVSPDTPTAGFWRDLVTNDRGAVALDRLQMVVWTVLLGGLYLHSVLVYVTMPDFSTTLLSLMGVSSGAYIGFKLPAAS
jgi:hypothetical protein